MRMLKTLEEYKEFIKGDRVAVLTSLEFDSTSMHYSERATAEYYYAILLCYLNKKEVNFDLGIVHENGDSRDVVEILTYMQIRHFPTVLYFKKGIQFHKTVGAAKEIELFFHSYFETELENPNES